MCDVVGSEVRYKLTLLKTLYPRYQERPLSKHRDRREPFEYFKSVPGKYLTSAHLPSPSSVTGGASTGPLSLAP